MNLQKENKYFFLGVYYFYHRKRGLLCKVSPAGGEIAAIEGNRIKPVSLKAA
jgi:hypothetical protein